MLLLTNRLTLREEDKENQKIAVEKMILFDPDKEEIVKWM